MTDYTKLQQIDIPSSPAATVADLPDVRAIEDRALSLTEIASLDNPTQALPLPPTMLKLLDSHHKAAVLVAAGKKVIDIAAETGYTPSTISNFKSDPAFQSLVEHYRKQTKAVFADVPKRMADLSEDVITEIHRRVSNSEEIISIPNLIKLGVLFLDRTGHGPTSKSEHTHEVLDSSDISRIKEAAASSEGGSIIDATVIRSSSSLRQKELPEATQEDFKSTLSQLRVDGAIRRKEEGQDKSSPEKGAGVRKESKQVSSPTLPGGVLKSVD